MPQFPFQKRVFLAPASSRTTSYIAAEVESGEGGQLIIADCHHAPAYLEFFLLNPKDRRVSLNKIDLLIEVLTAFREALKAEAKRIEKSR